MYCPNCKQEYDGKFCPECGTKLIEKPATSGVSLSLGDANAISGGLHVNDSHAVHNEDKSVHNITNTTSTVNNITQMSVQKTEIELVQERKAQYLSACKRAYEDNVLEQSEVIELEELRIKIGLDKATADEILDKVRMMSDRNARKSTLNPIAKTKLKILTSNLQKNEIEALMHQIDSIEPLVRRYDNDELSRKYYLVLSALKPERCIEQRESTKTDSYWESFWTYLAYIKTGRQLDADETLAGMDRFTSYPEDNITVLAAAGELIKGHETDSREYLTSVTGEYTPALQRFVDSINLLLDPEKAKESGADENTCAFYLVNFFGKKDPKASAYNYFPKDKYELRKILEELIGERGKDADLNDIDVSQITDMECGDGMIDLLSDDDDDDEDFSLFGGLDPHNIDISGWSVSKVENMTNMFRDCENFNCDLGSWDVSKVRSMESMFQGCHEFNSDLSSWDVSNVEDMSGMFQGCDNLKSVGDLSIWDTSSVITMNGMFKGCNEFNSDLSSWDVSNVNNMSHMFCGCKNFNCDLGSWDVSNVDEMDFMFEGCRTFNCDLSTWDVSNVYSMDHMFRGCKKLKNLPKWYRVYHHFPKDKYELRKIIEQLIKERKDEDVIDLNDIDVSKITDMGADANDRHEATFSLFDDVDPNKKNIDISEWDVSNVSDMSGMFMNCENFRCNLSFWDVSKVRSMESMFQGCKEFNSDLSSWNVSNVENMSALFSGCKEFNSDLSSWDVSNVEDMSNMFEYCENFNCDLSSWDVSNVKNMSEMFRGCHEFNSDLGSWDVSNVEDMSYMFRDCENFNCDLSSWDVSNVKNMSYMFRGCHEFNSDLGSWDVSNVEDMSYMFRDCENFNCDLSSWDVSNVKIMSEMFRGCHEFNSDLSSWDVSNVEDMSYMFYGCEKLENLPKWYDVLWM